MQVFADKNINFIVLLCSVNYDQRLRMTDTLYFNISDFYEKKL